jgi:hypothetical protein
MPFCTFLRKSKRAPPISMHLRGATNVYMNIYYMMNMNRAPTPGRNIGTQWLLGPAVVLGHLILPPSRQPWSRERTFSQVVTQLLGLLGSYLQHVTSTFNTCSRVPIHRSLIDTDGRYNLKGANFPHHSLHPSQPIVLCFPLMPPPGLRLTFLI